MDCAGLLYFISSPFHALLVTFALACRLLHRSKEFPALFTFLVYKAVIDSCALQKSLAGPGPSDYPSHTKNEIQKFLAID